VPNGFALGLAFGDTSCDVVPGRRAVFASLQDAAVQDSVELSVTAAVEAVAAWLAGAGGDWVSTRRETRPRFEPRRD